MSLRNKPEAKKLHRLLIEARRLGQKKIKRLMWIKVKNGPVDKYIQKPGIYATD